MSKYGPKQPSESALIPEILKGYPQKLTLYLKISCSFTGFFPMHDMRECNSESAVGMQVHGEVLLKHLDSILKTFRIQSLKGQTTAPWASLCRPPETIALSPQVLQEGVLPCLAQVMKICSQVSFPWKQSWLPTPVDR